MNTKMSSSSPVKETVENNPELEALLKSLEQINNQNEICNPDDNLTSTYLEEVKSFPGLIDTTSNSSIFGNVRIPSGSYINPKQLIVTLRNSLNETRSVHPNNIGRFIFENVPTGDYYIKVEKNDDILNINTKKPIILTNEKHIGAVNGDNCLFVQELGYYYDTDYNNDGHINETDVNQFMDTAKNYNVTEGNILDAPYLNNETKTLNVIPLDTNIDSNEQTPYTNIIPYTSQTEKYDADCDGSINSNDISNTITGGTWNDPKDITLVDRHNYDAFAIDNTIPNTFKAGEEGTFTISFKDISQKYSEDKLYLLLDAWGIQYQSDSGNIPYVYYSLDRLDSNRIKTTIINHEITEFTSLYGPNVITFTVKYEVPENIDSESTNLTFRLKHYTDFTFGKPLSKNISITNSNPSPQKPDWYKITTTDSNGRNAEIGLSDIGGSGGEKSLITAMVRRENESLWNTYQVIPAGDTYAWIDTGSIYASPPSKNGHEAVTIAEIPFIDDIVDSINKKKDELLDDFYSKIGINPGELTDEDKDMILQGVVYGIDDNVFFGAFQWVNNNKPYDNNYYFMRSKLYTDGIFTAAYTIGAVGSAVEANRALATAEASGALALAASPTVGGAVILSEAAITELAEYAIMKGVSFVSKKMAKHSVGILKKDFKKLKDTIVAQAVPKFVSRVIDPKIDSKIYNRVKELRGILTSDYKGSGNFGYADVNVSGLNKKEFFAHSLIDTSSFKGELRSRVPNISLEPINPVFDALEVNKYNVIDGPDAYLREWDTEYKIMNDVALQLGNKTSVTGTIKLFTDRKVCPSCSRVINLFMKKYKNITVKVIDNNDKILK